MICPCGREVETTGNYYEFAQFDNEGNIVKGICIHGICFGNWNDSNIPNNGENNEVKNV